MTEQRATDRKSERATERRLTDGAKERQMDRAMNDRAISLYIKIERKKKENRVIV